MVVVLTCIEDVCADNGLTFGPELVRTFSSLCEEIFLTSLSPLVGQRNGVSRPHFRGAVIARPEKPDPPATRFLCLPFKETALLESVVFDGRPLPGLEKWGF